MLCLWIRKLFPLKLCTGIIIFFSATLFHDVKKDIFYKTLRPALLKSFTCKTVLFNRLLVLFCFAFF